MVWRHVAQLISDDDLLRDSVEALNASRCVDGADFDARLAQYDRAIDAAGRRIDRLLREFGDDADEDVAKSTRAAVRDAQRERDAAKAKRETLLDSQRVSVNEQSDQADVMARVRLWRANIGRADFAFKRDVLDALDVRVLFSGSTVQVSTALSLPVAFEYMTAPRYRRMMRGKKF